MIKRVLFFLTALTIVLSLNSKATELGKFENNLNVSGYVQNIGQKSSEIKFYSTFKNMKMFVENNSIIFDYFKTEENGSKSGNVVKMKFENSNKITNVIGVEKNDFKINIIKNDNSFKNINSFSEIKIENLYNGIDLVLKIVDNSPRYDFIIKPNADPNQIKITFEGSNGLAIKNNEISLNTNLGAISHKNLLAFQGKNKVNCNFSLNNSTISFNLGKYDKSKTLVIDPIVFSAYFGGTGDEQINRMKYVGGYYYVTGWTTSTDLPVSSGAYGSTYENDKDVFVAKYQISGLNKSLIYCTYISGSAEDVATGIGVDETGAIYIGGYTYSDNFPKKGTLGLTYSGGADCFIVKLDKTGANLVYGALFGGSKDDFITDCDVSLTNNVHFIGNTNSSNLPVTSSAYQLKLKGGFDCLAGKISETGNLMNFLTYIGGSLDDKANSMKLDLNNNDIYFAGQTLSTDLPIAPYKTSGGGWGGPTTVTDAPYDYSANGGLDAIEAQVDNTGALALCGYFGGKADDIGKAIDIKEDGSIILIGETASFSGDNKFPISQNAYQKSMGGSTDIFIAVFSPIIPKVQQVQPLASSTYFGGSGVEKVYSVIYNKDQFQIAFCGSTSSTDFPKVDETFKNQGSGDAFLAKISPPLTTLTYTNLFGGTGEDVATGMYLDARGDITLGGYTKTSALNIVPTGNSSYKGGYDGFIYKNVFATLSTQFPQGGETKCLGENITLKWITEGLGSNENYDVYIFRTSDAANLIPVGKASATSLAWTIPNTLTPASDYKIKVVHNSGLIAESPATFILTGPPTLNSFKHSNSTNSYCENSEFKLSASVNGKNLTFKWIFNGIVLATNQDSTYVIPKLALNNAGKYSVQISGTCNPAITSQEIDITVTPETKITKNLANITSPKDKEVVFAVTASGNNLSYEWQRNGNKLLGETKSEYRISSVSKAMDGKYKCIVKGDCGTIESLEATLTVDTTASDVFDNYIENDEISIKQNINNLDIIINNNTEYDQISIIDNMGKTMFKSNVKFSNYMNISNFDFASGVYILKIENNSSSLIKKFLYVK